MGMGGVYKRKKPHRSHVPASQSKHWTRPLPKWAKKINRK